MLVEYLPVTAQFDGNILGNKAQALDEILDDSGVLALRVGHAVPEPVVQARALSIVLPVSGGILTFDDLVVEALDPGYALYSRDQQSTTTTTLTVMGKDVMGTIHRGAFAAVGGRTSSTTLPGTRSGPSGCLELDQPVASNGMHGHSRTRSVTSRGRATIRRNTTPPDRIHTPTATVCATPPTIGER